MCLFTKFTIVFLFSFYLYFRNNLFLHNWKCLQLLLKNHIKIYFIQVATIVSFGIMATSKTAKNTNLVKLRQSSANIIIKRLKNSTDLNNQRSTVTNSINIRSNITLTEIIITLSRYYMKIYYNLYCVPIA